MAENVGYDPPQEACSSRKSFIPGTVIMPDSLTANYLTADSLTANCLIADGVTTDSLTADSLTEDWNI